MAKGAKKRSKLMQLVHKIAHGIAWRIRWVYNKLTTERVWNKTKLQLKEIYEEGSRQPLDENKVIIIEKSAERLTNSFQYLYEVLERDYDFDIHIHYLGIDNLRRGQSIKACKALFADMADAGYVFMADTINLMGCYDRREGQKLVQLWHACGAFKRFGMGTANKIFGNTAERIIEMQPHKNYTRAVVSSPEICWAYTESFYLPKDSQVVQPLGVSRTDIFFDKQVQEQAFERVYQAFPAAKGKKIILFAPTFRGRVALAETVTPNFQKFYDALSDEYVLITKHHPFVKKLPKVPEKLQSFAFDATSQLSIEDLLMVSDICISDYSSLIFEYSFFTRPMLFYAYDLEEYFDWRGFYYPYEELTPGPVCRTQEELIDYIAHVDERFDPQVVKDFREKFMSACDGHATERILEDTMGAEVLKRHRKQK